MRPSLKVLFSHSNFVSHHYSVSEDLSLSAEHRIKTIVHSNTSELFSTFEISLYMVGLVTLNFCIFNNQLLLL